jgi:drug/metabolite transporter (DMT)-like permease
VLLFYGTFFAAVLWTVVLGPMTIVNALSDGSFALAVLGIAIVSTILSYGAFLVALKSISATNASIAAMLEPVAAGIGAALLFGEALTSWLVIGGAIILASVAFIQTMDSRTAESEHTLQRQ